MLMPMLTQYLLFCLDQCLHPNLHVWTHLIPFPAKSQISINFYIESQYRLTGTYFRSSFTKPNYLIDMRTVFVDIYNLQVKTGNLASFNILYLGFHIKMSELLKAQKHEIDNLLALLCSIVIACLESLHIRFRASDVLVKSSNNSFVFRFICQRLLCL